MNVQHNQPSVLVPFSVIEAVDALRINEFTATPVEVHAQDGETGLKIMRFGQAYEAYEAGHVGGDDLACMALVTDYLSGRWYGFPLVVARYLGQGGSAAALDTIQYGWPE